MDKAEFFKSIGFTEYEARALASFLRLKKANAKQLSNYSGVPQNKLYQILKKFEKIGIISYIPSESKEYKLLNIKTFINNKIKEKEIELKNIKEISKKIEEIKDIDNEFIFSLIKGQQTIMDRLAEQNAQAKKEILGVQRNWKVWGEGLRQMRKSIRNGTNVKLIGVINNDTYKKAVEWKKIGCQIRSYNEKFGPYPLRFTIIDNKEARITIGKPEIQNPNDYITIWTKSKPLIAILKSQFTQMWKESKKF